MRKIMTKNARAMRQRTQAELLTKFHNSKFHKYGIRERLQQRRVTSGALTSHHPADARSPL
jgi:hypothetical protein